MKTLLCPFCKKPHSWKKTKHLISFICPDIGIVHWTHHTREEVEEAKKEMEPVSWKTILIRGFFGKKEATNDYA